MQEALQEGSAVAEAVRVVKALGLALCDVFGKCRGAALWSLRDTAGMDTGTLPAGRGTPSRAVARSLRDPARQIDAAGIAPPSAIERAELDLANGAVDEGFEGVTGGEDQPHEIFPGFEGRGARDEGFCHGDEVGEEDDGGCVDVCRPEMGQEGGHAVSVRNELGLDKGEGERRRLGGVMIHEI